jgi:hypothetical protein
VGPRAGLDAVVKRRIPNLRWESNPRTRSYFIFISVYISQDHLLNYIIKYQIKYNLMRYVWLKICIKIFLSLNSFL